MGLDQTTVTIPWQDHERMKKALEDSMAEFTREKLRGYNEGIEMHKKQVDHEASKEYLHKKYLLSVKECAKNTVDNYMRNRDYINFLSHIEERPRWWMFSARNKWYLELISKVRKAGRADSALHDLNNDLHMLYVNHIDEQQKIRS